MNISGQLKIKSKKNILNLGFRGNSPFLQLATFKEYGLEKMPKNIFWFFSEENDFEEILRDQNKQILTNYLDSDYSQDLKNFQDQIDKNLIELHRNIIFFRNIKLQNLRLNFINKLIGTNTGTKNIKYIVNQEAEQIYFSIINNVKEIIKEKKINLHIVYLPSYSRYKGTDYSALLKSIEGIANSLNINFIDINKSVFMASKDPLNFFPFKINSHYTEEAYSKISDVLLKNIK